MTGHETQFVRQACVYFRNKTTIWFSIYIKYCTWLPATKYCYFHSKRASKCHRQYYQTHKGSLDMPISIKFITLLRLRVNYININFSYDQLLLVTVRPNRDINILSLVQFQIFQPSNGSIRTQVLYGILSLEFSEFIFQLTKYLADSKVMAQWDIGISLMHLFGLNWSHKQTLYLKIFPRTHVQNQKRKFCIK